MNKFAPARAIAVLCAVLGLMITGAAQTPRPDFNRSQTYDVQHYTLRVKFDRPAKRVIGDATVTLKPLKSPMSQVTLDSAGIAYQSVRLSEGGSNLKYRLSGDKITVDLPRAYQPDETVAIRFNYSAIPKKGIYFIEPLIENGKETRSAQIWTQGEAEEARHWFPSYDHPSDKATSEQYITANSGETVVANGELIDTEKNSDGTATYHYRMPVPHSTYLLSFVIGKYSLVKDQFGDVPLGYYVYPGKESIVPSAFSRTKDILRTYEELTGVKYPYNKYDQTIVSGFTFGGMENITATTLADTEVFLANYEFAKSAVEDLVAHEAAHSWFGNLVTCRNWAELWLNEGFATFMEAAFREKAYGRPNYLLKIQNDATIFMADDAVNTKRNGLFNENARDADRLFDRPATTYNKGGVVIHMLREELGDEAFWKAVNNYLNAHKFGSVESSDLKNAMETASGRDLDWFFDQWVYGTSHPKLSVQHTYSPQTKTYRIVINQTQKPDRLTPVAFRLPVEIEFKSGATARSEKIEITKRSETFTFIADTEPTELRFDPRQKIPLKSIKMMEAAKAAAK